MSVLFLKKSNLTKLIFAIFLALPISYLNFNELNFHGDYNYFKQVYNDLRISFIPQQISILETKFGATLDPLLVLIFFIAEFILSYEQFIFILSVLLFYIYIEFIYKKKNNLLFFLFIISSYYICAISAASPKNILALIFFMLSLKNFDNKKFFLYYYCSFFTHSAASVIFFLISFIFLKKDFYKILFDIKKIIILIIPIFLSFFSIYDKIYGYNILVQNKSSNQVVLIDNSYDKKEKKTHEFEKSKFIKWIKTEVDKSKKILKKKYVYNLLEIPSSLRSIIKFEKKTDYSQKVGEVVNNSNYWFNLSLSFSIYDLLKLFMITVIIMSLNRYYNTYLGMILVYFLVGLGLPRIYMFIHLLIIYLVLKSDIKIYRFNFYSIIFFSYIFYFFLKNIIFLITFYNTGFIYF